jgi:flagellar assembly protein FliH
MLFEYKSAPSSNNNNIFKPALVSSNAAVALAPIQNFNRVELEKINDSFSKGFKSGLLQGLEQGRAQGKNERFETYELKAREELNAALSALDATHKEFENLRKTLAESTVSDVIKLALNIAQKMTHAHLEHEPSAIVKIVETAVHMLPLFSEAVQIRLNPLDIITVQQYLNAQNIKIDYSVIPDEEIHRGGCELTTASNRINATTQQRWKMITETLGQECEWITPSKSIKL